MPNGYWQDPVHQRSFMDTLAKKLNINHFDDWYTISSADLRKKHNASGIMAIYGNSISQLLKSVYPEYLRTFNFYDNYQRHPWDIHKFQRVPQKHWKDLAHQRTFMDDLGRKLGFTSLDDWYNIRVRSINEHGGRGLLSFHGDSISKMLMTVYPEHSWQRHKFHHVPQGFWTDVKNQQLFMNDLSKLIKDIGSDYSTITKDFLHQHGGATLLNRYKTIDKLLKAFFPDATIRKDPFGRFKKAQRMFADVVGSIIGPERVIQDFRHPDLMFKKSGRIF
jgi:hypothetical protein